jgi:hypothetical protein
MPSFFPRLGVRVLAIAVATLAISVFLPMQVAQAAAATHLQVLNVSSQETANRGADQITVNAQDDSNSNDGGYSGTVTFSSNNCTSCLIVSLNSDMSSPLPGNSYTYSTNFPNGLPDAGTKNFYLRWNEAAVGTPQTLHVDASGSVTDADAANTTTVLSNNPTTLDWTAPQTNATQNVSENITITIKNAQGQTQPNAYTGTVTFVASCGVCFTITPNDGTGHETEYTFVSGDNSAKTFSLTWTTAGTGRSFTATGSGLSGTPSRQKTGISVQAQATTTSSSTSSTTSTSTTTTTLPPRTKAAIVVTAAGQGGGPHVIARKASDLSQVAYSFYAYDPAFTGGVRVASADVNGDGWDDIITAAGPGGGPHVEVFSGKDPVANGQRPTLLASFFAYDASFTGGVFVAAGDVNGDGKADIITAPDAGGGPHVRAFDGTKLANISTAELLGFMAYDTSFRGGVRVATADFNNDGKSDIVTAPGAGGGPHVRFWSGAGAAELGGGHGFFAYDSSFTGGVYLAAVKASSPYVITGAGSGGGRHVRILNLQGVEQLGFMADATSTQGAVPAVGRSGSMADGLFYVARATGNPAVQQFDIDDAHQIDAFPAYQAGIGVFVAVGVF